jgi:prepilin-type N-terminal cleavage/methylation domain-containing protein
MNRKAYCGFTLLELSIVLVIIGLVVGGVVAGRSMVRSSEVQSVANEANQYKTAIWTYKSKYSFLPGDHPKAEDYFGATATNNGNGDDRLYWGTPSDARLIWEHLHLSGMLPAIASIPASGRKARITEGNWRAIWQGPEDQNWGFSKRGNMLQMCGVFSGSWDGGILFASEAKAIDDKIDDGRPRLGSVVVASNSTENPTQCYTSSTEYNLIDAADNCLMFFYLK